MTFWDRLDVASGIDHYGVWLCGGIVVALVLASAQPATRSRMRLAILLLIASSIIVSMSLVLWPETGVAAPTAVFKGLRLLGQFLFAMASIEIAATLVLKAVLPRLGVGLPPILFDVAVGLGYLVVVFLLLERNGVNLSGIVATSAVLTGVIGFSMQDTLGNVIGGIALQAERTIAVGDWVRIGAVEGVVLETRWRQTSIETTDWATVIIPNSVLTKSAVTVLARRAGQARLGRLHVTFNVEIRHAPETVIAVVERAIGAAEIAGVAPMPTAFCVLTGLQDGQAAYKLFYWSADVSGAVHGSVIRSRIVAALRRSEIELAQPQTHTMLTFDSRARRAWLETQEFERRIACLRAVDLFGVLTEEERVELARALKATPFREGEIINHQGEAADYLYVLTSGEADVFVTGHDGTRSTVAHLGAGDVFGEMGLMTGEPRTATVAAASEVMCYRLDKANFQTLLRRRPALAEAIAALLAERRDALEAVAGEANGAAGNTARGASQGDLLRRIRQFFLLT